MSSTELALANVADGGAEDRPFDGLLVEISGAGEVEPANAPYPGGPVNVDGKKGRCVGYSEVEGRYIVQTFDGLLVHILEANLTEYEPPEPEEEDGFDVAWPNGALAQGVFAAMIGSQLQEKGYCVIQMFEGEASVNEVRETTKDLQWGVLGGDFEEEYLGDDITEGKVSWLSYEGPGEDGKPRPMQTYDLENMGADMVMDGLPALARVDKALTNVAALMWPLAPEFEDDKAFNAWGRTTALVRAGFEEGDPAGVKRNALGSEDADSLDTHLSFSDSKKLCILYVVDSEGGELALTPAPEAYEFNEATLPLVGNKIVVFRCDALGLTHTYRPSGRNLAFSTWVLDVPSYVKEREESLRVIDGPQEPQGQRNNVMAIHTRYPGCGFEPLAYWTMLTAGSDTQVCVPSVRWDVDVYYRSEHTIGFSMTCHGAMMQNAEVQQFDNKFFGIEAEEAELIAPYMRIMLEVGYETLYRAGHRREELRNWNCGVFVGDSGSDWDNCVDGCGILKSDNLKWRYGGRERSTACCRLSHIMGMKGPVSTAETACSSSLVACSVAQMTMRQKTEEQATANMSTDLMHGLVIGTNTLIGVMSYISLSGPGMLTTKGRCFTFDQSADGFARGEGVGGVKLKICNDSIDAIDRIAILIGCSANQDGRSASMTAPHGPSQQDVIRSSMREGGLLANMITIAECHGTGTALGDPIEVGALRGVMGSKRQAPILKTSAKTNIGHLEAAAGVAGLIKCIQMLAYSCGAPNCHLVTLNPHLDVSGFPVLFQSESLDWGSNSGLTGVSSFGFGGTNARADVWGHSVHGHRYCITGELNRARSLLC